MKDYTQRNEEIIRLGKTGNFTLQQLGDKFEITRERVRQIYKKETGQPFLIRRVAEKGRRKERAKQRLEEIAYNCKACDTPVKNKDRRHFLCPKCYTLQNDKQRDPYVKFTCYGCGIKYHPLRLWKYLPKRDQDFHSMDCYTKSPKFMGGKGRRWGK